MLLPNQLAEELKVAYKKKLSDGTLLSLAELEANYRLFRERFGIERLQMLDGEELLLTMHDFNPNNRDSMGYWLEYKNDDEFRGKSFGLIGGGSALKYGVYPEKGTGIWKKQGASSTTPEEISLEEAISIARKHREQLAKGVELLRALPTDASDAAYAQLQADMDRFAPNVSDSMWGHKYFSLLFPDKLDDYHVASFQRFYLIKLLQADIPSPKAGRYITAGRYVAIAKALGIPMNYLSSALNALEEKPHRYWSMQVSDWPTQYEGSFVGTDKDGLLQRIKPNDMLVALDSQRKVLGIGRVAGDAYTFPDALEFRLPVNWLSHESEGWQFPYDEGFSAALKLVKNYENQVEIERHLLEARHREQAMAETKPVTRISAGEPTRLQGVSGRIQSILERKGQVILYGPPGTGKTYWAEQTACELVARQIYGKPFAQLQTAERQQVFGTTESYVQLSAFHPAYGYEEFLEGYRPQLMNEQMVFARQDGIFKRLCGLAHQDPDHRYYLIIDEINRGDIPRIFGELLTVLEKDKRDKPIILPLSGERFTVPHNLFVLGTMNTADRSIALLDTALRRRFGFIELLPDASQLGTVAIRDIPLGAWLLELNKRILDNIGHDARNLQVGHAYFLEQGQVVTDFAKLARIIREDIIPLLEEYCYEDYETLKTILGSALVDTKNQVIRHELFEAGRENELVQALLEPTPDLTTLAMVTEADNSEIPDDDDAL